MKFWVLLLLSSLILTACNCFVAGDIRPERKALYEYNNNEEFCKKNPDRCVNGIPWL